MAQETVPFWAEWAYYDRFMLRWPVVPWAGRWRQMAEEEVHLYWAVNVVEQHRYCPSTAEELEGSMAVRRAFGAADATVWKAGVVLGGGSMRRLGHTPLPLPITCGRWFTAEGRQGSG